MRTSSQIETTAGTGSRLSPRLLVSCSVILVFGMPLMGSAAPSPQQAPSDRPETGRVTIPKVSETPRLDDFVGMQPGAGWEGKLARVGGFTQRTPDDGRPATQSTETYLGYDDDSLYVIFVAHDSTPERIRARLTRRESIPDDEDRVAIYLDTFHDRRRAYRFMCNPLGVQEDALYSEDADAHDNGFDTVWHSRGRLTGNGYIVWMRIPFKSLRFPHAFSQTWSIALTRYVGRRAEESWWPRVSAVTRGVLSQAATSDGLQQISPGRNLQLIPYSSGLWYEADKPDSRGDRASDMRVGLDGKAVIHDSLVLDLTARPDFSQVESDEPQVSTNQRYELFYPERRPFFTENSSYFDVPMIVPTQRLVFTRRIADPVAGARLTGKVGDYSIGALVVSDRAPGMQAAPGSVAHGNHALSDVFRVTRDLKNQSSVGGTYGERRFAGSFSRVADLDATFRIASTWKATIMAAYNWNRALDGRATSGGDVDATLTRVSRALGYNGYYVNRAKGFEPEIAFYNHSDWRELGQTVSYQWWPSGSWIRRVYSEVYAARNTHHNGDLSWEGVKPLATIDLNHNTALTGYVWFWRDAFGPRDFPAATAVQRFPAVRAYGASFTSSGLGALTAKTSAEWGRRANYVPADGQLPTLATYQHAEASVSLVLSRGVRLEQTYLFDRNVSDDIRQEIYRTHIARSRVNWQLNRELSLRLIAQYDAVVARRELTATPSTRRFNADMLLTYLFQPGTALYIGYTDTLNDPSAGAERGVWVRDSRQAFVKVSYLIRF